MCRGWEKKVWFSLINKSAGNKHWTTREGHVCALMPDGIMRHGCLLFGNQWKKLAFISVEWRGFSIQTWELFFGVRRSKEPHTVRWDVLSFCVLYWARGEAFPLSASSQNTTFNKAMEKWLKYNFIQTHKEMRYVSQRLLALHMFYLP